MPIGICFLIFSNFSRRKIREKERDVYLNFSRNKEFNDIFSFFHKTVYDTSAQTTYNCYNSVTGASAQSGNSGADTKCNVIQKEIFICTN